MVINLKYMSTDHNLGGQKMVVLARPGINCPHMYYIDELDEKMHETIHDLELVELGFVLLRT